MKINQRISAPRAGAERSEEDFDVSEFFSAVRRGKWVILASVLVAASLGAYYLAKAVPTYVATTTVVLDPAQPSVPGGAGLMAFYGDTWAIETEVGIITSRDLIGKLVDDLDLTQDPEFNVSLRPAESNPLDLVFAPFRLLLASLRELVSPGKQNSLDDLGRESNVRDGVVNAVRSAVTVENVLDSYLFDISVESEDASKAATLANALAQAYIRNQIEVKYDARSQAVEWLTERVAELKVELEIAEQRVREFNMNTKLVNAEQLAALNGQMKQLRERASSLANAEAELGRSIARMEQAALSGDPEEMIEAAGDRTLGSVLAADNGLDDEAKLQAFQARFDSILADARKERDRHAAQRSQILASLGEIEREVEGQSADLLQLDQLKREAEASQVIYEQFLSHLKEVTVQQGIQKADSRVVSSAVVPKQSSSPRPLRSMAASILAGLLIGGTIVLVRDLRRGNFRTSSEVERATGISVIGRIPRIRLAQSRRVLSVLAAVPNSAFAESVRNLRTSILLSRIDHPPQVVAVSSAVPGEGKTTLSLALAQSFAGMNRRVLLMEGDIRRRKLHRFIAKGHDVGLISAVQGVVLIEDAVYRDEHLGFDILAAETSRVNAGDFFASDRFREFLDQVRQIYDLVVIDTPPVGVVTDPRVIAQSVDTTVLVVRWGSTRRELVTNAVEAFASVNAPVSGIVLNQIDLKAATYYGEYHGTVYGKKYYRADAAECRS